MTEAWQYQESSDGKTIYETVTFFLRQPEQKGECYTVLYCMSMQEAEEGGRRWMLSQLTSVT